MPPNAAFRDAASHDAAPPLIHRLSGLPPEDGDKPFALVLNQAQGLRLAAVNAAALASGLDAGMALNDARAILPSLATAFAEPAADEALLKRLARWFNRYSPRVAIDRSHVAGTGPDGLFVDITGCAHLFGGEAAMLADMRDRLTGFGLTVHLAAAPTAGAAWALARVGGMAASRQAARPISLEAALAPLPITGLRLAAPAVADLARFGLKRIGDLAALPRAALVRRFDAKAQGSKAQGSETQGSKSRVNSLSRDSAGAVMCRLDQAFGRREEPVAPEAALPEHRTRRVFAEPIAEEAAIALVLDLLLGDLMPVLEEAGVGARALALALERVDGTRLVVEVAAAAPSREAVHFRRLYRERLGTLDPAFGIDEMTLTALRTEPMEAVQTGWQSGGGDLVDGAAVAERQADLSRLIDRLANRFGAGAVTRAEPVESHLPERAERFLPLAGPDGLKRKAAPEIRPRPATPPRPVRLLEKPEPIDVVAEVPEGPPRQFRWRRISHQIARAEGPERVAPEWWRTGGDGGDLARPRDYFRIENEVGQRFWVYRDGLYRDLEAHGQPAWFIHGLFA